MLASNNPGKVVEIKHMFNEAGLSLISPADLGLKIRPEETGKTFLENSRLKAWETFRILRETGYDTYGVIADDSGLEVDALGGIPGVDSALYLGESTSYEARNAHIIKQVENMLDRTARFVCVLTCILSCGKVETVRSEIVGEVAIAAKGHNGFGYDPIFYLPDFGLTMAELTCSEKNKLSHRGNAIRQLITKLMVEKK